jgi:hypothetical protein
VQHPVVRVVRVVVGPGAYSCDQSTSVVEVDINGMPINILQDDGFLGGAAPCSCNTCDGTWTFSSTFATPLAAYNYGGLNNVSWTNMAGTVCLNSVEVTVYYGVSGMHILTYSFSLSFSLSRAMLCGALLTGTHMRSVQHRVLGSDEQHNTMGDVTIHIAASVQQPRL